MESFRKAYGALKDSTKVGLAKVNSEFKDLDIAIVKATNHAQCPPKERHVRKIYAAVAITRPRADVGYCIHALSKRLSKTRSWIVAIKTLIVFHRILREGDPSFREQLMHIYRRGRIFEVAHFKDDSGPLAWDCSAWIRTYGFYLEERLECFRNLNYDIEADRGSSRGSSKSGISKELRKTTPVPKTGDLLDRLPSLQQLLFRLVCCQPEGAARHNFLVQYAMALVVKESFKVYCAINDGIINLVDMFFEMPRHEAVRALDIYKRAGRQADHLADFYEICRTLELARTFQFPTLRQPPPSFLATMEEYIKEAPLSPKKQVEEIEKKEDPGKPEEQDSPESEQQLEDENKDEKIVHPEEETETESNAKEVDPPLISTDESVDLLGLNEVSQKTAELDESNEFALAIVQPGNNTLQTQNASGWEVALVTAPSNINKPLSSEAKLAGGFNRSLLDSLYEDDMARRQIQLHSAGYSTSSYEYEMAGQQNMFDPFAVNHHQRQQMMMMQEQQQNMMTMVPYGSQFNHHHQYYQNQHHYPQTQYMGSSNPFGDPFGGYGQGGMQPAQGNHSLL